MASGNLMNNWEDHVIAEEKKVVVVGAGVGGLTAAICLALKGFRVTIVEKEGAPGGKMRQVEAGDTYLDGGPTVMTMKWVFDEFLSDADCSLDDLVTLRPAKVLARHWWRDGSELDLFADIERTAEAIATFSDEENADGYRRFCADSAKVFRLLQRSYIDAQRPGPIELSRRIGFLRPDLLFSLRPFSTLWSALGKYFSDKRLRQLYGRYATYCGSSPFQAPATLMLVAHVEQDGVWLVDGGMFALSKALADMAMSLGVDVRYGERVAGVGVSGNRADGIHLASGEALAADSVVFNGDVSALSTLLHKGRRPAPVAPGNRSLSAVTWSTKIRKTPFPLAHHSVFFSDDYEDEFYHILSRRRLPEDPTVYLCAQDRKDGGDGAGTDSERLFGLINAPADGDRVIFSDAAVRGLQARMITRLAENGFELELEPSNLTVTTPTDFERLFPGTGGALYGRASHGWLASFQRQGARGPVPGLYLAGGSVHPGPGVPMAALSGKLAAACLARDLGST
jgi:1-hydroxycarotenoid 3,4-desaturase